MKKIVLLLVMTMLPALVMAESAKEAELRAKIKAYHDFLTGEFTDRLFGFAQSLTTIMQDQQAWRHGMPAVATATCDLVTKARLDFNGGDAAIGEWAKANGVLEQWQNWTFDNQQLHCFSGYYTVWSRIDNFCAAMKRGYQDAAGLYSSFAKKYNKYTDEAAAAIPACNAAITAPFRR